MTRRTELIAAARRRSAGITRRTELAAAARRKRAGNTRRTELIVAALCAAWAAALLAGEGAALALAPLFGLAVLPFRVQPIGATLAVALLTVVMHALGVSGESSANTAAGLTVVYGLGRHAPMGPGYAALLALALALNSIDFAVIDLVFVLFILTITWGAGLLVRRRTEAAARAGSDAAELSARDPDAAAAQIVAEERARLAGDALAVVRRAVEAMQRDAEAAEATLDPRALDAIQAGGRAGVTELRRLLGLLRAEPATAAAVPADQGAAERSRWWRGEGGWSQRGDALALAALLLLCAVDVVAWWSGVSPGSIWLALAFAAAGALARVDAPAACGLAVLPFALAIVLDSDIAAGFSSVLAAAMLAWYAGADGRSRALVAIAAAVLTSIVVVRVIAPGDEAILIGAYAFGGLAGGTFGRREQEERFATAVAGRLRAEHEAAAATAMHAERLRLARELHDVASHAVGAMVLQAGAALALRERDPAAARAALRTVQASGAEAMGELAVLFGLLDAGAVGPAGLAGANPDRDGEDVLAAIAALAERMRGGGGLAIEVSAPDALPDEPLVVSTAYRIVQEALTNAARHAPGSRVTVELALEDGALSVRVSDAGGTAAATAEGGGFGLVGLAERVRGLGGDLSAGPAPGGGFVVAARLPAGARVAS